MEQTIESSGSELVKSVSIENLLRRRDAFKERIEAASALLNDAKAIYNSSPLGYPEGAGPDSIYRTQFEALGAHEFSSFKCRDTPEWEELIKGFDAKAWEFLMIESGMKTFMSAIDIEAWNASILAKTTPELTLENIQATFADLYAKRGDMMERGVLSIFRGLSWDYKTNTPVKFGKKIIIRLSAHSGCSLVDHHSGSFIDDLVRFMCVADGKPQPDSRANFCVKYGGKFVVGASAYESDYISIKGFMNGNAHIKLLRPDLVEKMNAILAKHFPDALPAPN